MRVAFLYNRAEEDPSGTAEDDVPERSPVVAALVRLGHEVIPIACTLNLADLREKLISARPKIAFNRVESLGGSDALAAAVPLLLDTIGLPYTGCSTRSLIATASKMAVKTQLVREGLPTPAWVTAECDSFASNSFSSPSAGNPQSEIRNPKYILKSDLEHASFAINDRAVIGPCDASEVVRAVCEWASASGRPYFAEEFVDGREFNLSLIGEEPEVLPPAEIDFSSFPTGKPRIVGHEAKWDEESFEYHHTPRRFDFPAGDSQLIERLSELARQCWRLFGLRGYARVDFRCDAAGDPWILEINPNPCIMPQAGFAAALERAGIGYYGGIQRILDAATPTAREGARSASKGQTGLSTLACAAGSRLH